MISASTLAMREPSAIPQMLYSVSRGRGGSCGLDIHWVDSPENQGEACNGDEEGGGLLVLALHDTTSIDG